jgi:pSer/pThr/pTyr-binding forkhead associated (FHA) protein
MKLLFPGGEHSPVELSGEKLTVGSDPGCRVCLSAAGIAPQHAEIEPRGDHCTITVLHPDNAVAVNGKPIAGRADFRAGDQITFAGVRVRAVAVERAAASAPNPRPPEVDDDGRTKIRVALPKFVLRGVSGVTFGKVFPLHGTMVLGRQSECEIPVPSEEVSRRHAELKVTPDGVMVEDLGSSNGTYVNDRRITRHLMKAGDELRLDTIRFLLLSPGQEAPTRVAETAPAARSAAGTGDAGKQTLMWVVLVVAVASLAAVGAKLAGWF